MRHFLFFILLALTMAVGAQVSMLSNIPAALAPNTEFIIEIKINKGNISNFSKYEMDLSPGFEAHEANSKTGHFSYEKSRVKIVWVTIPAEAEFIFSFKLKTPAATGPCNFTQKFVYIENGVKKEVAGPQVDVKVDASGVSKTLSYLPDEPQTPVKIQPVAMSNTVAAVTSPVINTNTVAVTPTVVAKESAIVTNGSSSVTTNMPSTTTATPGGMVYLVQIGSFSSDPGKAKFSDLGKVTIEKAGAVYKVLIGDFNTKEEAFKKREELTLKGYNGFVVIYQGGQRIK